MIILNMYFEHQAITGQQRYATEIARELIRVSPDIVEVRPALEGRASRVTDWIDLQTRLPICTRSALLLSLTSRSPFLARRHVVVVHDLFVLTNPEWYAPSYTAVHRPLLRHHLRHAEALIAVSEPVMQQLSEFAKTSIPTITAPNAASEHFAPEHLSDDDRQDFRLERARVEGYFLTVGTLEPRKNLGRLVDAYHKLPAQVRMSYPLLVVGGQSKSFRRPGPTVLADGVRLLGRVSDMTLRRLYTDATAFISVSLAEGFGIPVLEAAQCGAPLILSDITTYRWMRPGKARYVDPMNTASIADALLAASRGGLGGDRNMERDGRRFSWMQSARAIADFIGNLDR